METTLNGFDEFWQNYPRRVDKQDAMKAYKKALTKAEPGVLIQGAKAYALDRKGQEVKYTSHAATWLNNERWLNYVYVPKVEKVQVTGFYASFTSAEIEAWDAYGRKTRGKAYPRDRNGGWYFPTRWPPAQEGA